MKGIPFNELAFAKVNITHIAVVERYWKNDNRNCYPGGRDEHILSLTLNGVKEIYSAEKNPPVFVLNAPSIMLISKGAPYISHTILQEPDTMGHTICIRFRIYDEDGEELCFSDNYISWSKEATGNALRLFPQTLDLFLKQSVNHLQLKCSMLQILCELSKSFPRERDISKRFLPLLPAIEYMEENMHCEYTVAELAGMCFLSESYFRTLFREYTGGFSPVEYRNKLRIDKAEELLNTSLWSVGQIAETLGFYDVSHFYRIRRRVADLNRKRQTKNGSGFIKTV